VALHSAPVQCSPWRWSTWLTRSMLTCHPFLASALRSGVSPPPLLLQGEDYKLFWPEREEFIRMAVRPHIHGSPSTALTEQSPYASGTVFSPVLTALDAPPLPDTQSSEASCLCPGSSRSWRWRAPTSLLLSWHSRTRHECSLAFDACCVGAADQV